ncbi:MAG: hypothetical protein Q9174_002113, partial [Haloplaca sp. 1 TL-2023]
MNTELPSPPFHTAKTTQSTKSRRRLPIPFFRHQNLDSSESIPSPHSSLWDAPLTEQGHEATTPTGDWDAFAADITPSPDEPPKKRKRGRGKGRAKAKAVSPPTAIKSSTSTYLDSQVHHPHLLDTITERSSLPTIRSKHPSIISLRRESPSISTLRARASALRKDSFSLGDLPPASPAMSRKSSEESSLSSQNYQTTHLIPNTPIKDPPERPPTPPGLPTFNTPAAINYRLPSPKLSFRQRFSANPSPEEVMYKRQTSHLPPGVIMRGEGGELIRGRWRQGGQSGHTGYGTQGQITNHPFTRAQMAEVTNAIPVPVSEEADERTAIGPAEEEARVAFRKGTRWERFVELTCF